MKDVVKDFEEFEFGEFYYVRRLTYYSPACYFSKYHLIFTRLDFDNIAYINLGNPKDIKKININTDDCSRFKEDIIDFSLMTDEWLKYWIEKAFNFCGVYFNYTELKAEENVLKLIDPLIKPGDAFLGLTNISCLIKCSVQEDFSIGYYNTLIEDKSSVYLVSDILIRDNISYGSNNDKYYYKYYRGVLGLYQLAMPFDYDAYKEYYLNRFFIDNGNLDQKIML